MVGEQHVRMVGYPVIGRSGLGNELFPWARCAVWCHEHSAPMLRPQFRQIHIGPYVRRESDKRQYHRLFLNPGYISGWQRFSSIRLRPRLREGEEPGLHGGTIWFQGMSGLFERLLDRSETVRAELRRMTRPEYLPPSSARGFIAVHIRRGDFSTASSDEVLRSGEWNYRLPLNWFEHGITEVRRLSGPNTPVVVFSDGSDDELRPILTMPHVVRSSRISAVTDLLEMSRSDALIASGSTFSMWASYLGQMPTLWFPGLLRQRVLGPARAAAECELDLGQSLSSAFLS